MCIVWFYICDFKLHDGRQNLFMPRLLVCKPNLGDPAMAHARSWTVLVLRACGLCAFILMCRSQTRRNIRLKLQPVEKLFLLLHLHGLDVLVRLED